MVNSQLIPSDIVLALILSKSIWRKSNNCPKRTIFVSIHVVVVCGVMSHKPPCPGINSIAKFVRTTAPTATTVEESSDAGDLSVQLSHLVVNGTTLVSSLDESLDNQATVPLLLQVGLMELPLLLNQKRST